MFPGSLLRYHEKVNADVFCLLFVPCFPLPFPLGCLPWCLPLPLLMAPMSIGACPPP